MIFDSFLYMTPPRAKSPIPPSRLGLYESMGWIAQLKKNGQNSVIYVPPNRIPFAYNRHGERHKTWVFTAGSEAIFAALPGNGWWVFNGELLNAKVSGIRDINYLHDVLVADGELLLNTTYQYRHDTLCATLPKLSKSRILETPTHWILDAHTWIAKRITAGFSALFDGLTDPEDEGLVLKNPQGILGTRCGNGAGWMVKCRRPTKNAGF
jgi:hypothetical protein